MGDVCKVNLKYWQVIFRQCKDVFFCHGKSLPIGGNGRKGIRGGGGNGSGGGGRHGCGWLLTVKGNALGSAGV